MREIRIVQLNESNIMAAQELIKAALPSQTLELSEVSEGPEICLSHSLGKNSSNHAIKIASETWADANGIDLERLQYFVALDSANKMLGVSGIYSAKPGYLERMGIIETGLTSRLQRPNQFWMAYTAVSQEMQKGQYIGTRLMRHGMEIAKKISEKERIINPQWTLLADPGAISFYEKHFMHPKLNFGKEKIFETPLGIAMQHVDRKLLEAMKRETNRNKNITTLTKYVEPFKISNLLKQHTGSPGTIIVEGKRDFLSLAKDPAQKKLSAI